MSTTRWLTEPQANLLSRLYNLDDRRITLNDWDRHRAGHWFVMEATGVAHVNGNCVKTMLQLGLLKAYRAQHYPHITKARPTTEARRAWLLRFQLCECGDYRHEHHGGAGKCRACADAVQSHCMKFKRRKGNGR